MDSISCGLLGSLLMALQWSHYHPKMEWCSHQHPFLQVGCQHNQRQVFKLWLWLIIFSASILAYSSHIVLLNGWIGSKYLHLSWNLGLSLVKWCSIPVLGTLTFSYWFRPVLPPLPPYPFFFCVSRFLKFIFLFWAKPLAAFVDGRLLSSYVETFGVFCERLLLMRSLDLS